MNDTFNQNNQYGDNIMNFGHQPRKLNEKLQEQLKQNIETDSLVNVTAILGDGEAFNFATEIKNYLELQGYKVDGVNQAIFSESVKGQILEPPKNGEKIYKIIIGNNQ